MPKGLSHGTSVTSAFLFGHIKPPHKIEAPYAFVDHYRVIDQEILKSNRASFRLMSIIKKILENHEYDFINLSLAANAPVATDGELHYLTSGLDGLLAKASILATVAVGNSGEENAAFGLNRIKPPSDSVNALSVGACDADQGDWERASYSCVGPGRSPGIIKPDVVDFGGTRANLFVTMGCDPNFPLTGVTGTSFAAPSVLRLASGIRAHFGEKINHLAIKALIIHTSEESKKGKMETGKNNVIHDVEVGWGRVSRDLLDVVLCSDNTVRVIYQGNIPPSKRVRAIIPTPDRLISGKVEIRATICFKSDIDPHFPNNYTKSSFQVSFRPNRKNESTGATGLLSKPEPFFGNIALESFASEEQRRSHAMKWENCLNAKSAKHGSSLHNPCFDMHYTARNEGGGQSNCQRKAGVCHDCHFSGAQRR